MDITQITDHAAAARARLYDQVKTGDFADLVEAKASRYQDLEDALSPMIAERYLDQAVGQQLTNIGAEVGEPRPTTGEAATDDDVYRVLIYARIAANVSEGRAVDLLGIIATLGGGSPFIMDVYPASVTINYRASNVLSCNCISEILRQAAPPVTFDITQHTDTPFGFAGDSSASGFGIGEIGESIT